MTAKVVIATQPGLYGDKPRYPGERFVIANVAAFSKRWMLDPKDPDNADRVRSLEAEYVAQHGPKKRDISDEQLLAEVAQSGGQLTALRAENLKLKERIRDLEARQTVSETGLGKAAGEPAAAAADPVVDAEDAAGKAPAAGADAGAGQGAADGAAAGADGNVPGAPSAPATRTTRRRS
jgi:hypothetical protein